MEGISRAIILLIIMGMILFFLGEKAFLNNPIDISPEGVEVTLDQNTSNADPGPGIGNAEKAILRQQAEIDAQIVELEIERENIDAKREALEREKADLAAAKEDFQLEAERKNRELEIALAKLAEDQALLQQEFEKLYQKAEELRILESLIVAEQNRQNVEAKRLEAVSLKFATYEKIIFYGLISFLTMCAISLCGILIFLLKIDGYFTLPRKHVVAHSKNVSAPNMVFQNTPNSIVGKNGNGKNGRLQPLTAMPPSEANFYCRN
jgi:hypothetical protein